LKFLTQLCLVPGQQLAARVVSPNWSSSRDAIK
jgi:hypothetical protein